jgi:hypothetical protein
MDETRDKQNEVERREGRDTPTPVEPAGGQILIYRDGSLDLQVRLDGQTIWLTQAGMAELYQATPQNITLHIKAICGEGELEERATCKDYLQVRLEGPRKVQRMLRHYGAECDSGCGVRRPVRLKACHGVRSCAHIDGEDTNRGGLRYAAEWDG